MEWKELPIDNRYLVSTTGLIKGQNGRILKHALDSGGYKFVNIHNNGKAFHLSVHRAVALTFIPNPNNLSQVNHKDENKTNNNVENLEWMSGKDNTRYSKARPVLMLDITTGEVIRRFPALREVNEVFGNKVHSSISKVCRGLPKYKTAYGYKWRYDE